MKWWLSSALVGALSLALFMVLTTSNAKSALKAGTPEKAKVLIQEMKETDDTRRLLVPAKVEARVASMVTAEAEGLVTKIKKSLGSAVKAGDVVLYVENKDPAFTYAKVPVRAPVSGVVSQMHSSLMSRVSRGDKLFVVTDPKSLKLTAEIPGADLALVQSGNKGKFKQNLANKDGAEIRVTGISPFVDPRTGTASAEFEFTGPKAEELPSIGTVGHAVFEMNRGKILLIPESALGYTDGKPAVKLINDKGLVQRIPVELGEQKENLLVVKSGLSAGDKLIVRANRTVKEGEQVDAETSPN